MSLYINFTLPTSILGYPRNKGEVVCSTFCANNKSETVPLDNKESSDEDSGSCYSTANSQDINCPPKTSSPIGEVDRVKIKKMNNRYQHIHNKSGDMPKPIYVQNDATPSKRQRKQADDRPDMNSVSGFLTSSHLNDEWESSINKPLSLDSGILPVHPLKNVVPTFSSPSSSLSSLPSSRKRKSAEENELDNALRKDEIAPKTTDKESGRKSPLFMKSSWLSGGDSSAFPLWPRPKHSQKSTTLKSPDFSESFQTPPSVPYKDKDDGFTSFQSPASFKSSAMVRNRSLPDFGQNTGPTMHAYNLDDKRESPISPEQRPLKRWSGSFMRDPIRTQRSGSFSSDSDQSWRKSNEYSPSKWHL